MPKNTAQCLLARSQTLSGVKCTNHEVTRPPQFTVTVHIEKTYFPNEKESKADDGSAEEKQKQIKKLSSELSNDYIACKKTRRVEKCKV